MTLVWRGDVTTQLAIVMSLKPPLDSVPSLMALQWLRAMQSLMVMLFARPVQGALERDPVVVGLEHALRHRAILAAVEVDAVIIGIAEIPDPDTAHNDSLAGEIMLHPHRRVLQAQPLDAHVAAIHQPDEIGPVLIRLPAILRETASLSVNQA